MKTIHHSTTPSAALRSGDILLVPQPPLLGEEGKRLTVRPRLWCAVVLCFFLFACTTPAADPDTVTVAVEVSPTNLDPRIAQDALSQRLDDLMFSTLVRRNEKMEIVPDLALRWDMPDPKTYIFHLRNDARFHDGRPLTSKDVQFTFRSILDGAIRTVKAGHPYNLIESIETPDDYTVIFKLKEVFTPFLWNFTGGGIGIVPDGSPVDFFRQPIGSGPFAFVHYRQDEEILLKRNDLYYGERSNIEFLRFKIIPEAIVRALELRKGTVDVVLNNMPPDMVEVLRKDPNLKVMEADGTNYQYIAFNLTDPIFSNVLVRQAFAYGIDREKIIKYLWRDQTRAAASVLPPTNWAYDGDVKTYPYDPQRARELLKQAGQENLSITYKTTTAEETNRLMAAFLQQQLKEIGVTMEIRQLEAATFFADLFAGNFQMYSARWVGANNDPDHFNLIFHTKSVPPAGANRGRYSNPRVDALVEYARREPDVEKRKEAYREVQRIIADELPYISLFYTDNVCIYNKRLDGMQLYPAGDFIFFTGVRVIKDSPSDRPRTG